MTLTTSAKRAAGRREHVLHVGEDGAGLGDDVVAADELPFCVDRDDPADEQELARPHRVGEVRDRLGLARDPVLAALRHAPTAQAVRDATASDRAASSAASIVASEARSPTSTFTWKSRSRRVTRPTAPRPAKQSNVPRRSFMPDSGR